MMTTTPSTVQDERERRLARFLAEAGTEADLATFSVIGETLCMEGCVRSYSAKTALEKAARQAGFREVENCLRVVPGLAVVPRPN